MSQAKRLKASSIKSYFKRHESSVEDQEVLSTSHSEDDGKISSALSLGDEGCGDPIESASAARNDQNDHDDNDWTSPNQPSPSVIL